MPRAVNVGSYSSRPAPIVLGSPRFRSWTAAVLSGISGRISVVEPGTVASCGCRVRLGLIRRTCCVVRKREIPWLHYRSHAWPELSDRSAVAKCTASLVVALAKLSWPSWLVCGVAMGRASTIICSGSQRLRGHVERGHAGLHLSAGRLDHHGYQSRRLAWRLADLLLGQIEQCPRHFPDIGPFGRRYTCRSVADRCHVFPGNRRT
jgi:hypothetical protein